MTYGHLQADCLHTGISSGPNARYRVWEAFTFYFPGWKVMENSQGHGKSWKVMENDDDVLDFFL